MFGSAAFHSPDGSDRVSQRRPLALTASGPQRRGYSLFWIGPMRIRLLAPAQAGQELLEASYDFDLPLSGQILAAGRRYGYSVLPDGRIRLDQPLQDPLPAGARPQIVLENPSSGLFRFFSSGSDASLGQFDLRIRAAGHDSYFPLFSGFLLPAYFGGTDGLMFACGFRGNLQDWSGNGYVSFVSGPSTQYLPDGVTAGSGALSLDAGQELSWKYVGPSLGSGACEIWFRPSGPGPLLRIGPESGGTLELVISDSARVRALLNGIEVAGTGTQVEFGRWNFLAVTWKDSQIRLFLNGQLSAAADVGNFAVEPFVFAAGPGCGVLDEIRLFSRPMSLHALASHWNHGRGCGLVEDYLPGIRFDLMIEASEGPEAFWRQAVLRWDWDHGSDFEELPVEAARISAAADVSVSILPSSVWRKSDSGFIVGEFRWPLSPAPADAEPLVPTRWDWDPVSVGYERFSSGVARMEDLAPSGVVREGHSIRLKLRPGFFFFGPDRYYYPAGGGFRIVRYSSDGAEGVIHLGVPLKTQSPVLARTYRMDQYGWFRVDADFRRRPEFGSDPEARELVVADRRQGLLRLRGRLQASEELLVRAPDQIPPEGMLLWADLPVYPVWSVHSVRTEDGRPVPVSEFLREEGRVRLRLDPSMAGQDLILSYEPALLIVFEPADAPAEFIVPGIDLNPSASGLSAGYVVLTNRKSSARSLLLFCDKPRLRFEPSPSAQAPMVVYGPVYYSSDFAILMAQALGHDGQEPVSGLRLQFRTMPGFQGSLRYSNPLDPAADLTATTNGEGMAWMLYTPPSVYGFYIHPSLAEWDGVRLRLPLPADSEVYLPQVWDRGLGWKVRLYFVRNNHPYLGKVGANLAAGEVPWAEFGAIGTTQYRTNGLRELQTDASGAPVLPLQAWDGQGRPALAGQYQENPEFSGPVRWLEFQFPDADVDGQPDADLSSLGSYFLSLIGLVGIWAEDPVSGLRSNTIYLQLDMAPEVVDQPPVSGYLHLNDPQRGRINIHRLGGGPLPRFVIAIPKL